MPALVWVNTPSGWRGPLVKGSNEALHEQAEAEKHDPARRKKRSRAVRCLELGSKAGAPVAAAVAAHGRRKSLYRR